MPTTAALTDTKQRQVRFWNRYFWRAVVPSILVAIAVMKFGSNDWAAAAYIGWLGVTGPWALAIVTRRARLGGP